MVQYDVTIKLREIIKVFMKITSVRFNTSYPISFLRKK